MEEENKVMDETMAEDNMEEEKTVSVYSQPVNTKAEGDRIPRSRFAAAMLAFFPVGGYGAYHYYLGDKKSGMIKSIVGGVGMLLGSCIFGLGVPLIAAYGIGILLCLLGALIFCAYIAMYVMAIIDGVKILQGKITTDAMGCELIDEPKSRLATLLLGILCGGYGVYNFYLGNKKKGLIQLCVGAGCTIIPVFSAGVVAMYVWGLVESIKVMKGSITVDGYGNPIGR